MARYCERMGPSRWGGVNLSCPPRRVGHRTYKDQDDHEADSERPEASERTDDAAETSVAAGEVERAVARLEGGQEERQQQERLLAQQVEHERQTNEDLAKRRQGERASEDRHVEGRDGREEAEEAKREPAHALKSPPVLPGTRRTNTCTP